MEILARVETVGQADRVFSIFRIKRYPTDGVIQALQGLGWVHITGARYGQDIGYPRTLSLFQRRE